ncbi:MAG: glycosyltransferase family 4 protein, partial [Syntrophorhabdales bacterium]
GSGSFAAGGGAEPSAENSVEGEGSGSFAAGGGAEPQYLKIAILLDKFLPSRGGERYFSFLSEELARRGHEVHVFATEAEKLDGLPYRLHVIPVPTYPRWLRILSFWRRAGRLIASGDFDIVHGVAQCPAVTVLNPHGGVEPAYLAQEFASISNPFYYAYKALKRYLSVRHYLEVGLQRRLYGAGGLQGVIAISTMVKRDIIVHYAYPEERIAVVFNSVDLERFHPRNRERHRAKVRKGLGMGEETILLLFAGNNYRLKGLETLIRAVSLLVSHSPGHDFRLLVAGRGRGNRYRRLIARQRVSDRVIFAGPLPDMERYYAASDIYVHPTFYDSCSLTVLEALASGLPVVTTRFNGAADVIASGEGGAVIDNPADAHELARAILLFADTERRMAARAVTRSWMEQYPPERNVEETLQVYYEALRRTEG